MSNILSNQIAITVQNTISILGPMPNECGDPVKNIIGGDDLSAIMALGCYLDKCIEEKNYDKLIKGVNDIKRGQEAKNEHERISS